MKPFTYPFPCTGFGSYHGWAQGRLWFVCGRCRWYQGPSRAH